MLSPISTCSPMIEYAPTSTLAPSFAFSERLRWDESFADVPLGAHQLGLGDHLPVNPRFGLVFQIPRI